MDQHNNTKKGVYIAQWNARSMKANRDELKKFIDTRNAPIDVLCIQETWLKAKNRFNLPGFSMVRKDRIDREGGGVAILIRNTMPYRPPQD